MKNKFLKYYITILFFSLGYSNLEIGLNYKSSNYSPIAQIDDFDNKGNGLYSWLKIDLGNVDYINEMCMSRSFDEMQRGAGKKVKGFYGYSNQGYIKLRKKSKALYNKIIFGRAYINHGFSKINPLLISKWSRPFDQIGWEASYKGLKGKIYGAQLDPISNNNRYLSIHSIDFDLIEDITISFGESALYAGENRGVELQYFNPTLFWIPVRENQPMTNQANGFLYTGIKYSKNNRQLWFEFLLDDYQIDRSIQEPTTYGMVLGLNFQNMGNSLKGINFEYTRVANRTYQTSGAFGEENYIHRNYPIGHFLGNDFESLTFYFDFSYKSLFNIGSNQKIKISYLIDGSNGIDTPWDSPWMDTLYLSDGVIYKEDFPSKPLKRIFELSIMNRFDVGRESFIDLGAYYKKVYNGVDKRSVDQIKLIFRYWINFKKFINY